MIYSHEVEKMCPVAQGVNHGAAPIPEEAKWVKAKEVSICVICFQCESIVSSFILVRRLAMPEIDGQDKTSHFLYVHTPVGLFQKLPLMVAHLHIKR